MNTQRQEGWAKALRIPVADLLGNDRRYLPMLVDRAIAHADKELAIAWQQGFVAGNDAAHKYPPHVHLDPPTNPYLSTSPPEGDPS